MSTETIGQIIGGIVTIAGLYFTYLKSRDAAVSAKSADITAKNAVAKSDANGIAIGDLHIIVNDRLTQLLVATGSAKLAEGRIAGLAESAAAAPPVSAPDAAATAAAIQLLAGAAETARQVLATAERLRGEVPPVARAAAAGPDDILTRTLRYAGTGPADHPADPENRAS